MGIRKYKPTTPGRRGSSVSDFAEITRSTPEKSLLRPLHGKGGRHINVFVNGEKGGEETAIAPDDRVDVLPAISGGSA